MFNHANIRKLLTYLTALPLALVLAIGLLTPLDKASAVPLAQANKSALTAETTDLSWQTLAKRSAPHRLAGVHPPVGGLVQLDQPGNPPAVDHLVRYTSVACPAGPGERPQPMSGPIDKGDATIDADGEYAFSGTEGTCYLVQVIDSDEQAHQFTADGQLVDYLITDPISSQAASNIASPLVVGDLASDPNPFGQRFIKVHIPEGQTGANAYFFDIDISPMFTQISMTMQPLGTDPVSEWGQEVLDYIPDLSDSEHSAYFPIMSNQLVAIGYGGDDQYYSQISGGLPVTPNWPFPSDTDDLAAVGFVPPSAGFVAKDLTLVPGSYAQGTVNLGSARAADANAVLYEYNVEAWEIWSVVREVPVQADGSYRLGGLAPGATYTVGITTPDYLTTFVGGFVGPTALKNGVMTGFVGLDAGNTHTLSPIALLTKTAKAAFQLTNFDTTEPVVEIGVLFGPISRLEDAWMEYYLPDDPISLTNLENDVLVVQAVGFNEAGDTISGAEAIIEVKQGEAVSATVRGTNRTGWDWPDVDSALYGTLEVGSTVNIGYSALALRDKLDKSWTGFSTNWISNHRIIENAAQRVLTADDLDKPVAAASLAVGKEVWPVWTAVESDAKVGLGRAIAVVGAPTLSAAKPRVGVAEKVNPPVWAQRPDQVFYQWLLNGLTIAGATSTSFTPGPAELGGTLAVTVTAKTRGYADSVVTLQAPRPVAAGTKASLKIKLPRFAKRSKKLVAPLGPAGWTASYQWLRNGKAIKQATKRAFKVKKADRGKAIRVKVTLKRYGYTTTVLTSQRVEAR